MQKRQINNKIPYPSLVLGLNLSLRNDWITDRLRTLFSHVVEPPTASAVRFLFFMLTNTVKYGILLSKNELEEVNGFYDTCYGFKICGFEKRKRMGQALYDRKCFENIIIRIVAKK